MDIEKLIEALSRKAHTAVSKDDDGAFRGVLKFATMGDVRAVDLVGEVDDDEEKSVVERADKLTKEQQLAGFNVEFVISDGTVDRDGDTVNVTGHKLTNFKRAGSPVLFAHNRREPVIGRGRKTWVADDQLRSVLQVPDVELQPFGNMVGRLVVNGFMKASSIGFRPLEWERSDDEKRGPFALDFKSQELLEWSVVPVPANPNAVAGAKAAGIDVTPLIEWATKTLDEGSMLIVPRESIEGALREASGKGASVLVRGITEERALDLEVRKVMATKIGDLFVDIRVNADEPEMPPEAGPTCARCDAGDEVTDDGAHVFVKDGKAATETCPKHVASCELCALGVKAEGGFHVYGVGSADGVKKWETARCARSPTPPPDEDPPAGVDPPPETGKDTDELTADVVERLAEETLRASVADYKAKAFGVLPDF